MSSEPRGASVPGRRSSRCKGQGDAHSEVNHRHGTSGSMARTGMYPDGSRGGCQEERH